MSLASLVRYIALLRLSERLLASVSAIPLQKEPTNGHFDGVASLHGIHSFVLSLSNGHVEKGGLIRCNFGGQWEQSDDCYRRRLDLGH